MRKLILEKIDLLKVYYVTIRPFWLGFNRESYQNYYYYYYHYYCYYYYCCCCCYYYYYYHSSSYPWSSSDSLCKLNSQEAKLILNPTSWHGNTRSPYITCIDFHKICLHSTWRASWTFKVTLWWSVQSDIAK